MRLHLAGTTPTVTGPANDFTGAVKLERLVAARVQVVRVSFDAGARTVWHTHPFGQAIHVLDGVGRAQSRGGPVRESGRATRCGSRRARSIGTVRLRMRRWCISPCRRPTSAAWRWCGWSR